MSTSRNKQLFLESRASSSNHLVQDDCGRRDDEMKRLEERLRVLEEEAETLKEVLLESVEERNKMMNEIYEHFQTVQHCLLERGEELCTPRGISLLQNRKAGLLQILQQESNPSLVNRGLRANTLGYDAI